MRRALVLLAVAALAGSACGEEDPAGGAIPPASPVDATPPTTPAPGTPPLASDSPLYEAGAPLVADQLGLALPDFEREVAALGYGPVRVAWQDGEHLDLTADLVPGRVDVAVSTDSGETIVVDAYVETDPETGAVGEATIVDVFEGVEYYPACGNETLAHDGITWHQVNQGEYPDLYDRVVNAMRENLPESVGVSGFAARVVSPGPGDDIGTLVVWSDDVAYFVSDSGDLRAWLVTEELTYDWVC